MEKKKIFGDELKASLQASAKDKLYQFILKEGQLRGAIICGTKLINEMQANHELGILETYILGYSYISALLLSSNLKGAERLAFEINCDGPAVGVSVEANTFGEVKGYIKEKHLPITKPLEELNLEPFLQNGTLSVTKYLESAKHPFTGKTAFNGSNFALNLAHYSMQSEQTPSSYSLSINFNKEGIVTGAGGLLLQAMPSAEEKIISQLEEKIISLPSIGSSFAKGMSANNYFTEYFKEFEPELLSEKRVAFMCHCNRARFKQVLASLPKAQLDDIANNGPFPLVINCLNCNTEYQFEREELNTLVI